MIIKKFCYLRKALIEKLLLKWMYVIGLHYKETMFHFSCWPSSFFSLSISPSSMHSCPYACWFSLTIDIHSFGDNGRTCPLQRALLVSTWFCCVRGALGSTDVWEGELRSSQPGRVVGYLVNPFCTDSRLSPRSSGPGMVFALPQSSENTHI